MLIIVMLIMLKHCLLAAQDPSYVFLLSSKAGGVGLNIIGANRLVLFDPGGYSVTLLGSEKGLGLL
jgi:hypothetical protein